MLLLEAIDWEKYTKLKMAHLVTALFYENQKFTEVCSMANSNLQLLQGNALKCAFQVNY